MAVKPTLLGDFGITVTMVRKQQWIDLNKHATYLAKYRSLFSSSRSLLINYILAAPKFPLSNPALAYTVHALFALSLALALHSSTLFTSWAPLFILLKIPGRPKQLDKINTKVGLNIKQNKNLLWPTLLGQCRPKNTSWVNRQNSVNTAITGELGNACNFLWKPTELGRVCHRRPNELGKYWTSVEMTEWAR